MLILGIDLSSVRLGWALSSGDEWGSCALHGDIAVRCLAARDCVAMLLDRYRPALVAIEAPVARFARSIIPQSRVAGAILATLAERQALWVEIEPRRAKLALTGDGGASKAQVVAAAAVRLGQAGDVMRRGGRWGLWASGACVLDEDAADAYAIVHAARAVRVRRMAS